MSEKTFKGRIINKHDVESNWKLATNFTPLKGEIILYDPDENHNYTRVKIGDGSRNVNSLPFVDDNKVDKVEGKGLSTNDYTTEDKNALADLKTKVGDESVADQIATAMSANSLVYKDSEGHINIDRVSDDYLNSNLKITGDDIIFTDYAMDSYPILDLLKTKTDKGHKHSAADITSGKLAVANGGTGGTTAAEARNNLGVYSKDEHVWTKLYDSGEITSAVNAFANIDISNYRKLMVAVKCVNDGTNRSSKQGSITFTSLTGVQYQLPVWTAMFTNTEEITGNMGWFEITNGWIVCSNASRNIQTTNFLSNTEGGTADNLAGIGGGVIKCTKTLSKIMISALDQDENCFFNEGSRVIVWGGNA